jgi:hypothetical protein
LDSKSLSCSKDRRASSVATDDGALVDTACVGAAASVTLHNLLVRSAFINIMDLQASLRRHPIFSPRLARPGLAVQRGIREVDLGEAAVAWKAILAELAPKDGLISLEPVPVSLTAAIWPVKLQADGPRAAAQRVLALYKTRLPDSMRPLVHLSPRIHRDLRGKNRDDAGVRACHAVVVEKARKDVAPVRQVPHKDCEGVVNDEPCGLVREELWLVEA